ncbi:hypothetical protein GA0111570_102444 [Raineyella antarctica]|uniref:Sodium:proton antiporter n=1 Tax=Raineyella antarctica TaxID=1577474 RepID=A0A1G6GFP3_9ACTN|nr:DUF6328 family protein [Raineyella antarctica]SDB80653.1 hypothetical protein GA0111570_102444 [Raineyella antarctica]
MEPERHETNAEKMDRNWGELLQELRVTQTGVQILSGFLLTLPFQNRFTTLDQGQRTLYLVTAVLSVAAAGLLVAPVSAHRLLFRRGQKAALVDEGSTLAKAGLTALALTVIAVLGLVFSMVLDMTAAIVASACAFVFFLVFWVLVPLAMRRRKR